MLSDVCKTKGRLEQLVELRNKIAEAIDNCESLRDLAQLSRQYRETLKEIEEIKGASEGDDDIGAILSKRNIDGKSGAVR